MNPSWIVVVAGVSAALHVGKLAPAVTALQQDLGGSLVQAGLLLSTVQLAGVILGLSVGLGVDRLGLRRSMIGGLLLMAISSIAGTFAAGVVWLLVFRALEGLGLLLTAMPAPGLIRRFVQPAQLSARMGWWSAYVPLGSALALLLGPWVLQAATWRQWWVLLSVVSLLAALAVWQWVPADPLSRTQHEPVSWHHHLGVTLGSAGPWTVAGSFMLYSCQWMGVIGFLPKIYADAGLGATVSGALTALVAAANMLGNVTSGKLLQRGWDARRCLRTGFAVMGLSAVLAFVQVHDAPLAPLWMRFVAIVAFSAAGGLIPSSLFASVLHVAPTPDTVSTSVGFMQQLSCVGQFTGPPLLAAIATVFGGWQWTWTVTGVLCCAGWLLATSVQRQWKALSAPQSSVQPRVAQKT